MGFDFKQQWSTDPGKIAGYMRERLRYKKRWLGPLHRAKLPLKLIWGRLDPIAVYAIATQLQAQNPLITLKTLDDIGHYPQLEAADRVAAEILYK